MGVLEGRKEGQRRGIRERRERKVPNNKVAGCELTEFPPHLWEFIVLPPSFADGRTLLKPRKGPVSSLVLLNLETLR